jgi:serine/threonine protein kinase
MSFVTGENVGPYRIVEKLGQGGMATVYKAYHAALDRNVALKVLHPAFTEDPQFLERFHREAKLVARLEHSNIVPIFDFAEHKGQPYLVMKFILGRTLKARLKSEVIDLEESNEILSAVGDALTYAHKSGVLHRDVKPSNILMADDGRIYLADFGLARIAELGASTLSGDMLMGTPHYISPEQARGEQDLDERTDIYSLGIVLYEMVVGKVPFSADTPFSIIHDHIYTPLPLPSEVNPAVPENIQLVLLKALAKERKDRFESAQHLVKAYFQATAGVGKLEIPPVDLSDTLSKDFERLEADKKDSKDAAIDQAETPIEKEEGKPEASTRSSRNYRWAWVTLGIIITCFSLIAILGVANRPGIRTLFNEPPTLEPSVEQNIVDIPFETEIVDLPEVATPIPSEVANQPRLNPVAHVNRAEALVEEGKNEEAVKEFTVAGEQFLQSDQPVNAAGALIQAVILHGELDRTEDRKLISLVTQALFLSAPFDEIEQFADAFPGIDDRMPVLHVLEARRLLFTGEFEQAQHILNEALGRDQDNDIAKAIQVELLYMQGELTQASEILAEILDQPNLIPWLRDHLKTLENKIDTASG